MGRRKQTTTTETAAEIAPEIRASIAGSLSTYQALKVDRDLLQDAMDVESEKIRAIFDANGITKAEIDGVPCGIIRSTFPFIDKLKFVSLGGSLEMLENATVQKPKKPFLRIGKEKSSASDSD